jgi:hypothetical protein
MNCSPLKVVSAIFISMLFVSCDPGHDIKLENQTTKAVQLIYYPQLGEQELGQHKTTEIKYQGRIMHTISLSPSESIEIGHVFGRYTPNSNDIDLEFVEIRSENDTLKLVGKSSIYSTIQMIEKLNWRLVIKN